MPHTFAFIDLHSWGRVEKTQHMKRFFSSIIALVIFSSVFTAYGETRPNFGLKPIDDDFMALFNDATILVISPDKEYLLTSFFSENSKKFNKVDLMNIRSMMTDMSDTELMTVTSANYKDPTTMLIVSIFLGSLGVDRFMLGQTGLGIAKFLTGGGLGVWWLIDVITITNNTKKVNFKEFKEAYQDSKLFLPPVKG